MQHGLILNIFLSIFLFNLVAQESDTIHKHNNIYCVILAGGSGERLWPLSRQKKPKQLLTLASEKTLLEQAIDRISPLVPQENIWISTIERHVETIKDHVGDRVGNILIEPASRNTGPSILLSCLKLYEYDPDAIVVFVPADSFIPASDNQKFVDYLVDAFDFVIHHDHITLFGVKPTYPATGYGYIEFDVSEVRRSHIPHKVIKFREKPSPEVAQQYVESGKMLWNTCMFCGKVSVFIDEFKKEAADIFFGVTGYLNNLSTYEKVKAESIDYAVMEKSNHISVLPVDFTWYDVGNIAVFLSLKEQYSTIKNKLVVADAHNNLVDVPDKLVALVGIHDICIVETDDALLITKRDQAEQVRAIMKQLKQGMYSQYL